MNQIQELPAGLKELEASRALAQEALEFWAVIGQMLEQRGSPPAALLTAEYHYLAAYGMLYIHKRLHAAYASYIRWERPHETPIMLGKMAELFESHPSFCGRSNVIIGSSGPSMAWSFLLDVPTANQGGPLA